MRARSRRSRSPLASSSSLRRRSVEEIQGGSPPPRVHSLESRALDALDASSSRIQPPVPSRRVSAPPSPRARPSNARFRAQGKMHNSPRRAPFLPSRRRVRPRSSARARRDDSRTSDSRARSRSRRRSPSRPRAASRNDVRECRRGVFSRRARRPDARRRYGIERVSIVRERERRRERDGNDERKDAGGVWCDR